MRCFNRFHRRHVLTACLVACASGVIAAQAPADVALPAVADAYVRAGTFSAQNFGTAATLGAKKGVTDDNTRRSYLKFDVTDVGAADRVTLRLLGRLSSTASHHVTTTVYGVPDVTWGETSVTWNSRPPLGAVLGTVIIESDAPQWLTLDVTRYVRSEKAAGRNVISLALRNIAHSSAISLFNSREASEGAPALIVTPAATADTR
jgi:endoglucanase